MAHTKKMIAVVAVVEVGAVDKVASNKKSLFLKIAIVVAIVVVIVGIFIFKSGYNGNQCSIYNCNRRYTGKNRPAEYRLL